MKIKITQHGIKDTLNFPDDSTPQDILHTLISRLCDRDLLAVMKTLPKADFPDSVYTTEPYEKRLEFVTMCVSGFHPTILDYLIDTGVVSPDFVSKNGDPLLMFAAACFSSMFRQLLSKGAQLFVDGGIIRNKVTGQTLKQRTSGGSRPVVQNVLLGNLHRITDIQQLVEIAEWVLTCVKRKYSELAGLLCMINTDGKMTVDLRTKIVRHLILIQHHESMDYMSWAKDIPSKTVRELVELASGLDSGVAYNCMVCVFPALALHKKQ